MSALVTQKTQFRDFFYHLSSPLLNFNFQFNSLFCLTQTFSVSPNLVSDDRYKLETESKDNTAFIEIPQQNYGTYKQWNASGWEDAKEPLDSYVNAIAFLPENSSFQSILCVSETIGEQKIAEPKIIDRKFVCSQNTEELYLSKLGRVIN